MSWVYVPGLEALNSVSPSPLEFGEKAAAASVTWKGKLLLPQAWSRRWRWAGYLRPLFGAICAPSTANAGADLFISLQVATRAKATAWPESGSGPRTNGFSRPKSSGLPASAGLILSSGKMLSATPPDSSPLSSPDWKALATALRREYSRRPKPEIPCDASVCSSWRAPSDVSKRGGSQPADKRAAGGHSVNMEDQAEHWKAPNVPTGGQAIARAEKIGNSYYANGQKVQFGLARQAEHWSGPKASDAEKGGPNMRGSKGDVPLPGQAVNWPAPSARDWKSDSSKMTDAELYGTKGKPLARTAMQWEAPPDPQSSPVLATPDGPRFSNDGRNSVPRSAKRKLNPLFVEALMRWPTGLSDCGRAETASILSRRPTRFSASPERSEFEAWREAQTAFLRQLCSGNAAKAEPLRGEISVWEFWLSKFMESGRAA